MGGRLFLGRGRVDSGLHIFFLYVFGLSKTFLKIVAKIFFYVNGIVYISSIIKTVSQMRKNNNSYNRYPEGFTPKNEYYQAMLSIAVDSLNIEKIKFYTTKLEYFMNRQKQLA